MLQDPVNPLTCSFCPKLKSCTGHCQSLAADCELALQNLVNPLTCYFCPKLKSCTGHCQSLAADGGLVVQEVGKSVIITLYFLSQTQKLYGMLSIVYSCQWRTGGLVLQDATFLVNLLTCSFVVKTRNFYKMLLVGGLMSQDVNLEFVQEPFDS